MRYAVRQVKREMLAGPSVPGDQLGSFLSRFDNDTIECACPVGCIVLTRAAIKPSSLNSFAEGYIIPYPASMFEADGGLNDAVASIRFESGPGGTSISVQGQPHNHQRCLGRSPAASESAPPAAGTTQQDPDSLQTRGRTLYKSGDREAALRCFDAVIALQPDNMDAWYWMGNCLSALGRVEEALNCYDTVIRLAPGDEYAWLAKAEDLARLNRIPEALECFRKAVSLNPAMMNAVPAQLRPAL
jgi:tetratricopeptide (TPR) repeat protein